MKRLLFTAILILSSLPFMAFMPDNAKLKFQKTSHAFGKIKINDPVTYAFEFTNASSTRIIIEDATAECGCTKPTYPMQPIQPGKTGKISVTYDAKTPGVFNKKITVKLVNDNTPVVLSISGEVVK